MFDKLVRHLPKPLRKFFFIFCDCCVCKTPLEVPDTAEYARWFYQSPLGGGWSNFACLECLEKRTVSKSDVAETMVRIRTGSRLLPKDDEWDLDESHKKYLANFFEAVNPAGERNGKPILVYTSKGRIPLLEWMLTEDYRSELKLAQQRYKDWWYRQGSVQTANPATN